MYANGRAPESALVVVDGVHMVPSIAPRVRAFMDYARSQGRTIRPYRKYGGYRNLVEQAEVTKGGGSKVDVASVGRSTHGDFLVGRVDLVGEDGYTYTRNELAWIVENAPAFGLYREFGAADPNHFKEVGAFAGGDVTPITPSEEEEESDMDPKVIVRTEGPLEYSLVAPWLVGSTEGERGYIVTTNAATGLAWARAYAHGDGKEHARVARDGYVEIQAQARRMRDIWLAGQPAASGSAGVTKVAVDLAPVVAALQALGAQLAAKIDALPAEIDRYADGKKQS